MKSFKNHISEVAQPEPAEEKKFKDQHKVDVKPHPVATEFQHKGVVKPKAKRKADQEGDANYDMAYESVNEAEDAASPDEASMAMDQADFIAYVAREMKEHLKAGREFPEWMQNKLSKLQQAAQDLHGNFGDHGDDDMDESLSAGQKKLDHNKNGKIDAHDFHLMRKKKMKEEAEVEQIDELSQKTLWNYHAKAGADLQAKRKKLEKGTLTSKDYKQGRNRAAGLNRAADKMHEEEVVEVTRSAVLKPVNTTDKDGKTRTVYKSTKTVARDEHGQEKMKTNESVLDEAFKAGIVKFSDKSSMVVKKEDADILNTLFKSLSGGNRKKMEEVAMRDKKGFDEILSFAKEAM